MQFNLFFLTTPHDSNARFRETDFFKNDLYLSVIFVGQQSTTAWAFEENVSEKKTHVAKAAARNRITRDRCTTRCPTISRHAFTSVLAYKWWKYQFIIIIIVVDVDLSTVYGKLSHRVISSHQRYSTAKRTKNISITRFYKNWISHQAEMYSVICKRFCRFYRRRAAITRWRCSLRRRSSRFRRRAFAVTFTAY